jgi:hypothetical protein
MIEDKYNERKENEKEERKKNRKERAVTESLARIPFQEFWRD